MSDVNLDLRGQAAERQMAALLEQLLLLHRRGGRVDRTRLLRRDRHCRCDDKRERQRAGDQAQVRKNFRHNISPSFKSSSVAKPAVRNIRTAVM